MVDNMADMAQLQREKKCRLCGMERAIPGDRHPIQKTAHRDTILKVLDIDVSGDAGNCPPYICVVCNQKLKKAMKIKHKKMRGTVTWNIPSFDGDSTDAPSSATASSAPASTDTPSSATTSSAPASQSDFAGFVVVTKQMAHRYGVIETGTSRIVVIVNLEPVTAATIFRLAIFADFSWQLEYRGQQLTVQNTPVLSSWPSQMTCDSLDMAIQTILTAPVCTGHRDLSKVVEQCTATGKLVGHDKTTVVAYQCHGSIRSPHCPIIMEDQSKNGLCAACGQSDFRSNLRARESYLRKEKSPADKRSKFTPHTHLTDEQKGQKLKDLSETVHKLHKQVNSLRSKVDQMLDNESVDVNDAQHEFLTKMCKENENVVSSQFPEGSAQSLLWQQQLKRQKVKGVSGMRWHPTVVRWCISMFIKSPAAYRQLAQSGFLYLPSQTTLKSYINFTQCDPDINVDILKIIVKEFNLPHAPQFQTNATLVWDEMKIKSGLVVGKGSGKVVGFCSLDNFNEELQKLSELHEHDHKPTSKNKELATHIIVFMVRSMMSKVNLPFLWYPCTGFNSDQLWAVVWKATRVLEDLGLQVRAWTCDGATPNRKFFRIHEAVGGQYQGSTYFTANRYAHARVIYFICDVPHLVKTVRNNLENSHGHQNSKSLMKDGKVISWAHIVSTVEEDLARGLVRMPKIREEHIHLSPQLRMRVGLAAQVLSTKMSQAILARRRPELEKTAEFCSMFDRWFDCLNGRQRYGPKPDLNGYESVYDQRLVWLNEGFLGWLNGWEAEIAGLDLSKSEKNRFVLSYQTSEGLKISTNSFIALVKEVLSEPGAEYLLPEKLNQDRLEVFFSKVRRGCGDSDNPTVEEARHRILALIVAGRAVMAPRKANAVIDEDAETQMYMPRRKRLRK